MPFSFVPKFMQKAGIEQLGIDYWVERFNSPKKMRSDFDSCFHLKSPINWYNPKIVSIVKRSSLTAEERAYFYLAFLTKLVPSPAEITSWSKTRAKLDEIEVETGFGRGGARKLPTNRQFLAMFDQRSNLGLEEWTLCLIHGDIWELLFDCMRPFRNSGLEPVNLAKPYVELLDRLLNPKPPMDIKLTGDNGLLIIRSHNRFGHEFAKQARQNLKGQIFAVRIGLTRDELTRNIVPLTMLKTLKSGKAVYAAVDYGPGNFNLEGSVFGLKVPFPESTSWAAWKSNCNCQWIYLIANHESIGTWPCVNSFSLPDISSVSKEEFTAVFVDTISKNIETATVDHPFSFGPYKGVRHHLISTT